MGQHNLVVTRKNFDTTTTIGNLVIDGKVFSDTLELAVMPPGPKIDGKQAIPYGEYDVVVNFSQHMQKRLPLIYNRPDYSIVGDERSFAGVRFHGGNTYLDSLACILVGHNEDIQADKIWNSASDELTALLDNGEVHKLLITK